MEALRARPIALLCEEALIRDLTRGFASTLSYRKSCHRCDAVPRRTQRIEGFAQAETQRTNHAGGYDCDTRRAIFSARIGRFRHFSGGSFDPRFPVAFLKEALY